MPFHALSIIAGRVTLDAEISRGLGLHPATERRRPGDHGFSGLPLTFHSLLSDISFADAGHDSVGSPARRVAVVVHKSPGHRTETNWRMI